MLVFGGVSLTGTTLLHILISVIHYFENIAGTQAVPVSHPPQPKKKWSCHRCLVNCCQALGAVASLDFCLLKGHFLMRLLDVSLEV